MVLALVLGACGSAPPQSGSPSAVPTVPPSAGPEAVNAVNLLLDLQTNAPTVGERLTRVENGAQIAHAVTAELAKLQFVGVSGVAVSEAKPLTGAQCSAAHLSVPCLSVHYAFVGSHVPSGEQTAYVVTNGRSFVVSRQSACNLAQPVSTNGATELRAPSRPAC